MYTHEVVKIEKGNKLVGYIAEDADTGCTFFIPDQPPSYDPLPSLCIANAAQWKEFLEMVKENGWEMIEL
jgi:hypothetical protein